MKNKLVAISIVLLLLALIPSTSMATETPPPEDSKLFLKGLVVITKIENNTVYATAYRLLYYEQIETETTMGRILLNEVAYPDGFITIPIPRTFGSFIIGFVKGQGGIEVF